MGKLAKQHQRDVSALDERFKQKMVALAARFKALEAEEAKTALVKKDNEDLKNEVGRLEGVIGEYQRRQEEAEAAMAEKERDIQAMVGQMSQMADKESELQDVLKKRRAAMVHAEEQMSAQLRDLQSELAGKKEQLSRMQDTLRSAKDSYDDEVPVNSSSFEKTYPRMIQIRFLRTIIACVLSQVRRKRDEIATLEGSMGTLQEFNERMRGFVTQVHSFGRYRVRTPGAPVVSAPRITIATARTAWRAGASADRPARVGHAHAARALEAHDRLRAVHRRDARDRPDRPACDDNPHAAGDRLSVGRLVFARHGEETLP